MDRRTPPLTDDSIVVTGLGHIVDSPCDPTPYLKVRKNRKFMGVQDDLAVVATGIALENAALPQDLGERAGVFLAVGYIPFERSDIDQLLEGSVDNNEFSMQRMSTVGYHSLNPLLTFRCLSNMPAFHISANFNVQGPYFVTYPGAGQFYIALDQAYHALSTGTVDIAIVGGVAHQRNFLVHHHFGRVEPPVHALSDAGACLILESAAHARRRGATVRAHLSQYDLHYEPHDPFETSIVPHETGADSGMGPASLPVALNRNRQPVLSHDLVAADGIRASSVWELL